MRVSLGFDPAWYHRRCGVDLSQRWHTDPYYRHDALVKMKAELCRSFPEVAYWDIQRTDDLWTLSGCYGAYLMPAIFGCRLRFAPDKWVEIADRPACSLEELAARGVDDILASPIVEDVFRQMDIIESAAGTIHGYLNWQGVLNTAFNVRGERIFLDIADTPDVAHRFFTLICDVMITLMQTVQERQRRSGFAVNQGDVSNCVMNMVSPKTYREHLFVHDNKIAQSFERFGVHTCNWDATPYLEELQKLPKVGYLDMGMMSDLKKAKAMFPNTRRAVMYSPARLQDASREEIEADMSRIYEDYAPCDIVVGSIQATTPDSRVHELLDICRKMEMSGAKDI